MYYILLHVRGLKNFSLLYLNQSWLYKMLLKIHHEQIFEFRRQNRFIDQEKGIQEELAILAMSIRNKL